MAKIQVTGITTPQANAAFAAFAVGTRLAVPQRRDVWGIGDSLTARGNNAPTGFTTPTGGVVNWNNGTSILQHALLGSNGRLRYGGVSATAGYTTAQVLATHLPVVLAQSPKPGFCVVLAGTNGVGSVALSSQMSDLTSMWTQLIAAGIQPIACTIPPAGAGPVADNSAIIDLNNAIKAYCRRNGIIVADLYAAVVDPSTGAYQSAYDSGDHTHPSAAGAQAMGNAVWAAMSAVAPAGADILFATNTNANQLYAANNLLMTGSGSPSDWGAAAFPSGTTQSLATDANCLGQAFTVTNGGTGNADFHSPTFTLTAGHKVFIGMKVKGTPTASGNLLIRVEATDGSGTLAGMDSCPVTIANLTTMAFEFVVPSGITLTQRIRFVPQGTGSPGTSQSIAQITMVDLTARGLTSYFT